MGELGLADAKVLRRLLLGDAALLAQQRNDPVKFDPHGPQSCSGAHDRHGAGPQWCPLHIFYTLYIIAGEKRFVNPKNRQILCRKCRHCAEPTPCTYI